MAGSFSSAPSCWTPASGILLQVGRQAKAGCNPFTIQVADKTFLDDSNLGPEDFAGKRLRVCNLNYLYGSTLNLCGRQ